MDRFSWHLAQIFKRLQNWACVFQFSCRFAFFYQLFVSQTGHRKYHEFWRCIKETRQLWRGAIFLNIYLSS